MSTVPAATPLTTPVAVTVASVVELLLQIPPDVASVNDTVLPMQTMVLAGAMAARAATVTWAVT